MTESDIAEAVQPTPRQGVQKKPKKDTRSGFKIAPHKVSLV